MYISNGNIKVKANIFNLPAGKTCLSCLQCQKYCYAKKAEYLYPGVKQCRNRNLADSQKPEFPQMVFNILKKRKVKVCRIHESGDFYSKEYILKWFLICNGMPEFRFYAYTKRIDLFTNEILSQKPDNLTLINSLDGIFDDIPQKEIPIGFDKIAVIVNNPKRLLCPALWNKNIKCIRHCRRCLDRANKIIVFSKH
jgi:ferredoxin